MIVLDANILIRAVLGKHIGQLLEKYSVYGVRFYAPDTAFSDAEEYLPSLLRKKAKADCDLEDALVHLRKLVEPVDREYYCLFEEDARMRLRDRDEEDWPVLATALALRAVYGLKTPTSLGQELLSGLRGALRSS